MPTFVLIGHCGPDSYLLKNAIKRAAPGAAILSADDEPTLQPHLRSDRVLLVNRVLDGGFETDSGIDLISRIAQSATSPVLLLVSNHADAQEQAVAAGGMPGFGKRDVNSARTAERLRAAAQAAGVPQSVVKPPAH